MDFTPKRQTGLFFFFFLTLLLLKASHVSCFILFINHGLKCSSSVLGRTLCALIETRPRANGNEEDDKVNARLGTDVKRRGKSGQPRIRPAISKSVVGRAAIQEGEVLVGHLS